MPVSKEGSHLVVKTTDGVIRACSGRVEKGGRDTMMNPQPEPYFDRVSLVPRVSEECHQSVFAAKVCPECIQRDSGNHPPGSRLIPRVSPERPHILHELTASSPLPASGTMPAAGTVPLPPPPPPPLATISARAWFSIGSTQSANSTSLERDSIALYGDVMTSSSSEGKTEAVKRNTSGYSS